MTQLPESQSRYPVPKHAKRLRPKTYSIAVYMVVLVVVLQVAMLISVFWLRAMVVHVSTKLPKPQGLQASNNQGIKPNSGTSPKPEASNLPNLPSLQIETPRPALLTVPKVSDQLEQIGILNDEALAFVKQHALQSAIEILNKAEDIDPRHPETLKNLAKTYALMGDAAQAKIYWQRLVDLGPGVGTIYANAEDNVVLLGGPEANILNDPSAHPRQVYVESVAKTPVETTDGKAQFHLRATLARKDAGAPFDQKKLQPYVIFYQQMPDGSLVPDLGQRKGSFDDKFLFWGDKKSEAFGVDYVMPIPGSPGPNDTTQGKYYGFVIGLYYNKVLQDVRSEPSDLSSRMALPRDIE
jgi:hypothetical protein